MPSEIFPRRAHCASVAVLALSAALGAGCVGRLIEGANSDANNDSGGAGGSGNAGTGSGASAGRAGSGGSAGTDSIDCSGGPDTGASRMRRITQAEYDHAANDLFGDASRPGALLSGDERAAHFAANTVAPATLLGVEEYMAAAERVAESAVARLGEIVPCAPETGDETCARAFITERAAQAYRRPLEAAEIDELLAVYRAPAAGSQGPPTFGERIGLVIRSILQSPDFLYRVEVGTPSSARPGLVQLTDHEIASRLSFLLWGSVPDQNLLATAESGALRTADGVAATARQMMQDPKFLRAIESFHLQWLEVEGVTGLSKDAGLFPEFTPELARSMQTETLEFVRQLFQQGDARLDTLLSAPFSFVDRPLADLYGLSYPAGASGFVRVALPAGQRAGILTQASVLAVHAHANQNSPVKRGAFIREHVLCQPLKPPPPTVNDTPPDPDPNATTRERFNQHTRDPGCAACHSLMDPIGFGFEAYDAVGRFRSSENGIPIDVSGALERTRDIDGPFNGAVELIERLRGSEQVKDCVAQMWLEFAIARLPASEDACSLLQVQKDFEGSGYDLRELVVSVVRSDAFRHARTGN